MNGFFSNPKRNLCSDLLERSTPSTLQIPFLFSQEFERKIVKHGSISIYLSYLIRTYRYLISNGLIDPFSKVKTLYQEEGLNLMRYDFRPVPKDWAELKCLRFSLNCSMNWIFVFLLELDLMEIPENLPKEIMNRVVPTLENFKLIVKCCLSIENQIFNRYFYLKPG